MTGWAQDSSFLLQFQVTLEIATESGDFVIPSQTLRISSGLRLRTASKRLFCHSEAQSAEESHPFFFFSLKPAIRDSSGDLPPRNDRKKETLWLRLREMQSSEGIQNKSPLSF